MTTTVTGGGVSSAQAAVWTVLGGVALCHCINDVMQSLVTAIYPLIEAEFSLSYTQIGFLTFAFTVTASVLQPLVGAPLRIAGRCRGACRWDGRTLLAGCWRWRELSGSLLGAMLIGIGSSSSTRRRAAAREPSGGRFRHGAEPVPGGATSGTGRAAARGLHRGAVGRPSSCSSRWARGRDGDPAADVAWHRASRAGPARRAAAVGGLPRGR
jgi:FSR family fosmidomycin resistance protein-like MFS transporter